MTRIAGDAYQTDDRVARALINLLPIEPENIVLEPHVGGGSFARVLREKEAVVIGLDIDASAEGFKHCHVVIPGRDFLAWNPADLPRMWIAGNPPYTNVLAHIEKALSLAVNVAFLLRLSILGSKKRMAFWAAHPAYRVWPLAERPAFSGAKGVDNAEYGWFWWNDELRAGRPTELMPSVSWR